MGRYEPVIGLEIHMQSKTNTKMFCSCTNGLGLEETPNIHICPVCTAHPGTLPVPNRRALVNLAAVGFSLNTEISPYTWFERKSYFYPDLPKGYQISQYERPLCANGVLRFATSEGETAVGIRRVHMEEDTGKLQHEADGSTTSIDYNRAGVPLMELVTEPDIKNGEEASAFCEQLQLILRYLGVSDADMEKGQMRCEVNISMKDTETEEWGTKVEVKNLNSFRSVRDSIEYEIERQTTALTEGSQLVQETRGWDMERHQTFSQRGKEEAHDYRYFWEPDIPPFHTDTIRVEAQAQLVELPYAKKTRFGEQYAIEGEKADTLVKDKALANYFEQVVSELRVWAVQAYQEVNDDNVLESEVYASLVKQSVNYLLTELIRQQYEYGGFDKPRVTAENFAEFITIVNNGTVSSSGAQTLLEEMVKTEGDPSQIVEAKNLAQISDEGQLEAVVNTVIENNPNSVSDYQNGNTKAIQFLVGQIMKETKGKANPQMARDLLTEKLQV